MRDLHPRGGHDPSVPDTMRSAHQPLQRDHIRVRVVLAVVCDMRYGARPGPAPLHALPLVRRLQTQTVRAQVPRARALGGRHHHHRHGPASRRQAQVQATPRRRRSATLLLSLFFR